MKSNPLLRIIPARSCVNTSKTIWQNSCIWTPLFRYVLGCGKEEFGEMAVRLTFGCILVQRNTPGSLGSKPSSLQLVQGSLCLLAAGGPWSQESCYLYGQFCSILIIPLEPLTATLSPHTQNKDPYESRHSTPWYDRETPKLQTSEKWGAKQDQCIYNGHLSAALHKTQKARELNIACLNYG